MRRTDDRAAEVPDRVQSVEALMTRELETVSAGQTVAQAERVAETAGVHHLLVVDGPDAVGVVCLCDTARATRSEAVGGIMKSPFVFICTDWSISRAADLVRRTRVGFLPVADSEGRIVGVVTRRDLRRAGLLSDEPGVDRCASCGSSHGLSCSSYTRGIAFCRSCLEQVSHSMRPWYFTLGGGD